jgi:RNA polymerase sigma factor (sigma-70 family)
MENDQPGSVTACLHRLQNGESSAAERELVNRYLAQIAALARKRLCGKKKAAADAEDVALSVMNSFLLRAKDGRFPDLHDRTGLWNLLARITVRKAINHVNHLNAQYLDPDREESLPSFEVLVSREPSPELAAEVTEQFEQMMEHLGNDTLRKVAQMRLEGYTNEEIAQTLGCCKKTVIRKVQLIQQLWRQCDQL